MDKPKTNKTKNENTDSRPPTPSPKKNGRLGRLLATIGVAMFCGAASFAGGVLLGSNLNNNSQVAGQSQMPPAQPPTNTGDQQNTQRPTKLNRQNQNTNSTDSETNNQ